MQRRSWMAGVLAGVVGIAAAPFRAIGADRQHFKEIDFTRLRMWMNGKELKPTLPLYVEVQTGYTESYEEIRDRAKDFLGKLNADTLMGYAPGELFVSLVHLVPDDKGYSRLELRFDDFKSSPHFEAGQCPAKIAFLDEPRLVCHGPEGTMIPRYGWPYPFAECPE